MKWLLPIMLPVGLASSWASAAGAGEPATVDYLRDIKPLLTAHCYECHGAQKQKSGLRLDTAAALLRGGDSGPALEPGRSSDSLLVQALTGAEGVTQMPPKEPRLSEAEVALIRAWIDQGARAPANEEAAAPTTRKSDHWAFQRIVRPQPPPVHNRAWVRNSIDAFILARLEQENVEPSPEADRVTLIRRLSLDLLGLPPSPAEVDAFTSDPRGDAYERLVDRLLSSPHYGERWGRHWLDMARYADSNGFTRDTARSIWKYRDWVIAALNRDLPFDRFAIEQIAGDMLPGATIEQKIATGFHRNTMINEEGGTDPEQFRIESVVDRVATTASVFLGLTVGCAQCHDHKYDPISQREYYQFFAFFNNASEPTLEVPTPEQIQAGDLEKRAAMRKQIADLEKARQEQAKEIDAAVSQWEMGLSLDDRQKLPIPVRNAVEKTQAMREESDRKTLVNYFTTLDVAQQKFPLLKEIAHLRKNEPVIITTMILEELPQPRETHIHLRGDFLRHGARVEPAVPAVLPPLTPISANSSGKEAIASKSPGRLDLARWLVSVENPLTPRVLINRLWLQYFGAGLVTPDNDFGTQGSLPTHPELLDWLSAELIEQKWSLKAIHRLIVSSATYRQSSRHRADLAEIDPNNKLLARQCRLRLDAEIIRDVALSASGHWRSAIGGPSVFPPQPEGVFDFTQDKKVWNAASGRDRYRRGLYTYLWRSSPYPAMTVFDFPEATVTCTRRSRSNTPLQSLTVANDQAFVEFARDLANRVLCESTQGDAQRLLRAFRLCLAREPRPIEAERLASLLGQQRAEFAADPAAAEQLAPKPLPAGIAVPEAAAWTALARVLLNLDEFITRE